ncbi:MAG: polymer-forming cytoskeletal protein [Patescibacteria group bacterium]
MKRGTRFSIIAVVFIASLGIIFSQPQTSLAAFTDTQMFTQKDIYIGSDQTINDNFVGFGENIEINGPVNGDIIVAGTTITINSVVQGDVIAAGNTINIKGEVMGNVRVAGSTVNLDAVIGKNTNVLAQSFSTSPTNSIGWSLVYGAETMNLKGTVGGHVDGGASTSYIAAKIGGNANIYTNDENGNITLTEKANIAGNLSYSSINKPNVSDLAVVGGEIIQKESIIEPINKSDFFKLAGITGAFFKITSIFGLFIVGLIIISMLKKGSVRVIDYMQTEPLKSFGWGIVLVITVPIACFILLFTVIGIPLSIIVMVIYMILLYVSKIFVGLFIGRWALLNIKGKKKKDKSFSLLLAMIIGVTFVYVITSIPIIGWFINILTAIWAFGAIIETKKQYLAESNK